MVDGYHAFLSYSRADEAIAADLQKSLSRLMRRPLRRSYLRIFRDRTSLTPGGDLGQLLRHALDKSDRLILLLSQASAESPWVNEEILHWMTRGPEAVETMLLLRCDNTVDLVWLDRGLLRSPGSLPPALASALLTEPFYIDVVDRNPDWADEAAVLVASGLLGRQPADIASDDLRQHRRMRRLATVGCALLAVLTVVASIAGVMAQASANRADRNAVKAEQNATTAKANEETAVAFALTAQAEQWIDTRPGDSLGLAITALDHGNRADAMSLIRRTLSALPAGMWFAQIDGGVTDVQVAPSGDVVAILSTHVPDPSAGATEAAPATTVRFFDLNTFELIAQSAPIDSGGGWARFMSDGSLLVVGSPKSYVVTVAGDRAGLSEVDTANLPARPLDFRLTRGTDQLLVLWAEDEVGDFEGFARIHLDEIKVVSGALLLVPGPVTDSLETVEFGTISSHGFHFVVGRGFKLSMSEPWARVYRVSDVSVADDTNWVDISPGVRPVSASALDGLCYAGEGMPDKPCGVVNVLLSGEAMEFGDRSGGQQQIFLRDLEVVSESVVSDPGVIYDGFTCGGLGYITASGLTIVSEVGVDVYEAPKVIDESIGEYYENFVVACSTDGRWIMVTGSGLVRIGRGSRSGISGTATATRVTFDGPGVDDGSIGTPDNILIRRGDAGDLELVSDGTVIATAGLPGSATVSPGETLVPLVATSPYDVTGQLRWGDLEYSQGATFPDAGAIITIEDVSLPSSPRRVLDEVLYGDQLARAMFVSDGALLGYVGSVHGEYLVPTLFLFGDDEILRLACGVGARVPTEVATALGVRAGVPSICTGTARQD